MNINKETYDKLDLVLDGLDAAVDKAIAQLEIPPILAKIQEATDRLNKLTDRLKAEA